MPTELTLKLTRPYLTIQADNTERVTADAQLILSVNSVSQQESQPFPFTAPIGLLEEGDLKWYLERYYQWPVGLFKERAERIEQSFPEIGKQLFSTFNQSASTQHILQAWLNTDNKHNLLFTINVQPDNTPQSLTASSRLLAFPWELLQNQDQYLLAHSPSIRIHRNIGHSTQPHKQHNNTKLRILALSPRPLSAGYIDHRISILPLLNAVESLGKQVELVRLTFATFDALESELKQAQDKSKPFHVLHFDGHGVFNEATGQGALVFENKEDNNKSL